jgi:hypothetical protein
VVLSTEELVRLTVAALLARTGEQQRDLAAGLGLSPTQLSRKQSRQRSWSLDDLDALSRHYGIPVPDLVCGPTHAVGKLPDDRLAEVIGGTQTLVPLEAEPLPDPVPSPPSADPSPPTGASPAPAEPLPLPVPEPPASEPTPAPAPTSVAPAPTALKSTPAPASAPAAVSTVPSPEPPAAESAPAPLPVLEPDLAPDGTTLFAEPAPCVLCGRPTPCRAGGRPQHVGGFCLDYPAPAPAADGAETPTDVASASASAGTAPAAAATLPPARSAPAGLGAAELVGAVRRRVTETLEAHEGDAETATAALIRRAIPDVMELFQRSRVGARYEHTIVMRGVDILTKKSQKGADQVWEARPKWANPEITREVKAGQGPFEVTVLDANAAYLAAFKSHLPIGMLKHDTTGAYDPKRAGVYLITPPTWEHPALPNPIGNRRETGPVWVTVSTLRLLLRLSGPKQGLCEAPVIHEAYVSGSSEGLLEKLRQALVEVRQAAIAAGDEVTLEYVKAMYSKFVSTLGESTANRDILRADWMHIIRAQAFTNLWLKAHKAHAAGLTVVKMQGTDELHLTGGDWRTVFSEGRGLTDMKLKNTYTIGG